MKKIFLCAAILCCCSSFSFAQDSIPNRKTLIEALNTQQPNITQTKDEFNMSFCGHKWALKKGDKITIGLPVQGKNDFIFIEKKKNLLASGVLSTVGSVVGAGATIIGVNSSNISTMISAWKVASTAEEIGYGLENLNNLNISNQAKQLAGKVMEVKGFKVKDGNHTIEAKLGKKNYEINAAPAIIFGEINIPNKQ